MKKKVTSESVSWVTFFHFNRMQYFDVQEISVHLKSCGALH